MDGNKQTSANETLSTTDIIIKSIENSFKLPPHEHNYMYADITSSVFSNRKFLILFCHCGNTKFVEIPE